MAYWSIEDKNPPTYHTCTHCPSGRRIKLEKIWVGSPPGERIQCAICLRLEAREAREAAQSSIKAS